MLGIPNLLHYSQIKFSGIFFTSLVEFLAFLYLFVKSNKYKESKCTFIGFSIRGFPILQCVLHYGDPFNQLGYHCYHTGIVI